MANPALIIASTGGIAFITGWKREGKWPANGTKALVATGILMIAVSATIGSRIEPIVRGIAWLGFIGVVYAAVPEFQNYKPPVNPNRSR